MTADDALDRLERAYRTCARRSLPSATVVEYARSCVDVTADGADVGGHLDAVLGTHMTVKTAGATAGDAVARVRAYDDSADTTLLEAFRHGRDVEIFPLRDSFMAMNGVALERAGVRWIWNRKTNSVVRAEQRDFIVLGPTGALTREDPLLGRSLQQDVLRIVRDVLLFNEQRQGSLMCHAAAIDIDGAGLAVVCARRGGKTTFVSKVFADTPAPFTFVSGDRILVQGPPTFLTHGWPGYTNIGLGTMVSVPALHSLLPDALRDAPSRTLPGEEQHHKVAVSHHAYQAALRFEVRPSTQLRGLVFPVPEEAGLAPVPIDRHECARRLVDNVLDLIATEETNWLGSLELDPARRRSAIEAAADTVATRVPAYRLGTPDILTASPRALVSYARDLARAVSP